jgi:flagellar basal body-associated protein FliL
MADQPAQTESAPPKKKKKLPLTLGIVLGVAIAEAAVFFLVFKMGGSGPQPAHAEESHAVEGPAASQPVGVAEVPLLKSCRVPNDKSGRMYIYDLDLSVVVPSDQKERMEGLVKQRAAEIGDRMARILRSASDRMLKEDDLRALRQQMLEGLREIMGEESLIERVLIPRFVPMRAD